jgi:hypothetical protein
MTKKRTVQCDGTLNDRGRWATHIIEASTKRAQAHCFLCGSPVVDVSGWRTREAARNAALVNSMGLQRPDDDDDDDDARE